MVVVENLFIFHCVLTVEVITVVVICGIVITVRAIAVDLVGRTCCRSLVWVAIFSST